MRMIWQAALVIALLAAGVPACSGSAPETKAEPAKAEAKPVEPTPEPKPAETKVDPASAARRRETVSKKVNFANEKWLPLDLATEGIELKEIRFAVEGGINFNPLRAGKGPQVFMPVKNTSDHGMKFAVAVALFDDDGGLVAASEVTYGGTLDPGEGSEVKITFRDVKRRFFDAKTAQVALETYK